MTAPYNANSQPMQLGWLFLIDLAARPADDPCPLILRDAGKSEQVPGESFSDRVPPVQYKKIPPERRKQPAWCARRNRLVCELLDKNPHMLRREALRLANRMMREK